MDHLAQKQHFSAIDLYSLPESLIDSLPVRRLVRCLVSFKLLFRTDLQKSVPWRHRSKERCSTSLILNSTMPLSSRPPAQLCLGLSRTGRRIGEYCIRSLTVSLQTFDIVTGFACSSNPSSCQRSYVKRGTVGCWLTWSTTRVWTGFGARQFW